MTAKEIAAGIQLRDNPDIRADIEAALLAYGREQLEQAAKEAMSSKTHDYNAGIAAAIRDLEVR